jgi:hypothetical protein
VPILIQPSFEAAPSPHASNRCVLSVNTYWLPSVACGLIASWLLLRPLQETVRSVQRDHRYDPFHDSRLSTLQAQQHPGAASLPPHLTDSQLSGPRRLLLAFHPSWNGALAEFSETRALHAQVAANLTALTALGPVIGGQVNALLVSMDRQPGFKTVRGHVF